MSEFKFFCPQCGQHIAADELYRGSRIECPTCGSGIEVPKFGLATSDHPIGLPTAHPKASGLYPIPQDTHFMTEEEYNRKFAEATDRERGGWGLFWMLLLAPATLTLVIVTLGRLFFDIGTLEMLLGLLLLCSGAISAFLGDWLEERVSQGDFEVPIIKPILGFGIFLVNFYIIVGPGCSLLPH